MGENVKILEHPAKEATVSSVWPNTEPFVTVHLEMCQYVRNRRIQRLKNVFFLMILDWLRRSRVYAMF